MATPQANAMGDAEDESTQSSKESVTIPVRWEGLEDSPLIYANSILSQFTEHEFIITFAQIHPPPSLPGREIGEIEYIRAKAATRIVLSPGRFKELLEVLQTNYDRYLRRKEDPRDATEADDGG